MIVCIIYNNTGILWHDGGPLLHELARRLTQEEDEYAMFSVGEIQLLKFIRALFPASNMQHFCITLQRVAMHTGTSASTITEAYLRIWGYERQASKQALQQALEDIDHEHLFHYVDEYFEGKFVQH